MLTELCQELKNWFELKKYFGTFTIEGGQLADSSFLQNGQYFRIVGSVFNDGVHQKPADDLVDESFEGAIWAMAVPPTVIALSEEIQEWRDKYDGVDSVNMGPYSSESFGGYSYSRSSGNSSGYGNKGNGAPTWQSMFVNELNRWRKI